jgi:transposase
MKDTLIGLDLAKTIFHCVAVNRAGKEQQRKKLRRSQMMRYFHRLEPCKVAMEACASSHYWARQFQALGHDVVLLPPQHVKAYLRGQKNDYNDARAIAEAAHHGSIKAVPIKSVTQQDEQAFHRIRKQLSSEQTRLTNQMRGLLAEYGIIMAQGEAVARREIPLILGDVDNGLSETLRGLIERQYQRFVDLDNELAWYQRHLQCQAKTDETCKRLCEIPAFGPVVSSAFKSWIGDGKQFKRGRDASAALGVVPRQHSTGGKEVLLGITKRGDSYMRSLLIHGARSVVMHAKKKTDPLSVWINQLVLTRGFNKAVVALANKLVRIAWVIVRHNERYQPPMN